jgi:4-hydroxy-tetrahydrodipicolinate synthase
MKTQNEAQGICTAIITPFTQEGSIDWKNFQKLIEYQIQANVDAIVLCGTTGESPTLSVQEKLTLIKKTQALLPKSINLIAGTGSSNTQQSAELSKLAIEAGADSLLVVTPPYNKPNINGLCEHYQQIASHSKAPICLYHVPGRTSLKLTIKDFEKLAQIPEIKSIKEASADLELFTKVSALKRFDMLAGDDATFLPSLAVGSKGVVSVLANIMPKELKLIQKYFFAGELKKAQEINFALIPLISMLFCETNPCPLKALMSHLNLCENHFRSPLAAISKDNYKLIVNTYNETKQKLESLI